jgi:glyoxylase-like metal-dependent hydrolase (beta-lactamase superfamily II)
VVVSGYVVRNPRGVFLFDTGVGVGEPEAEELYKPVRRSLRAELSSAGVALEDVRVIANCHLHFDHAGGNYLFPRVPIFAQKREMELAHEPDYTLPEPVCDFDDATFEVLDGAEAEPLPGLTLIPTPGHTDGHQSLVVETAGGRVVLAGQAFNEATQYGMAHYAYRMTADGAADAPPYPSWIERFEAFDPVRVLFAHDLVIWERDQMPAGSLSA